MVRVTRGFGTRLTRRFARSLTSSAVYGGPGGRGLVPIGIATTGGSSTAHRAHAQQLQATRNSDSATSTTSGDFSAERAEANKYRHRVHFTNGKVTMGAMGDSYFEYLIKQWIQGGKRVEDVGYIEQWIKAMNEMS